MPAWSRAIRPEEQEACLNLWERVFAPGGAYFERYFRDSLWKPEYTRVYEVDGQLAAAVQMVRRPVRLANGKTLWMAGIANVATLPDYRGHGFASQLLRDLHAVMDVEDFAFGLLFTGIHDFYARLGWERLPLPLYRATPAPMDLGGWRFRAATHDDLPRLQRWYDAFYADHPLTVVRDDAYWRIWTRWDDPTWRAKFYLAEDPTGVPRGYLALETYYGTDAQGNRVVEGVGLAELGTDPTDAEAVRMLVGFASQTAHMANAELQIHLPESDVQRRVRPLLSEVRWVGPGGAMVRVCCWQTGYDALESLGAPAPEGLAQVGQAGALALLLGLPDPPQVNLPADWRTRYPNRLACYSPVDSF